MGRTQRLFTGKSREAAQLMVTNCSHRGCDIPATLCDVDHRAEWVRDRGPTDQANASPMCGAHDRWKHANRIRTRRATNGHVYLIEPDGTTVLPAGAREPDWAEPPPADLPPENDVGSEPGNGCADSRPRPRLEDMTVTVTRPRTPPLYNVINGELHRVT